MSNVNLMVALEEQSGDTIIRINCLGTKNVYTTFCAISTARFYSGIFGPTGGAR